MTETNAITVEALKACGLQEVGGDAVPVPGFRWFRSEPFERDFVSLGDPRHETRTIWVCEDGGLWSVRVHLANDDGSETYGESVPVMGLTQLQQVLEDVHIKTQDLPTSSTASSIM